MPTHYNRPRRRKKKSSGWDWERAAQGVISGGALGFQYGGPKGAAVGALVGGGAGGLSGRDTSIDATPYEEALEYYGKDRRRDARMQADQFGADAGASFAARGLNASELAAGTIATNRGRIRQAAESDIGRARSELYIRIADAEHQANAANDAETRQGWLTLARQLGFQLLMHEGGDGGDGGNATSIHPDDPFPELRSPDAYPDQLPPNFNPNAPASTDDPFPELRQPYIDEVIGGGSSPRVTGALERRKPLGIPRGIPDEGGSPQPDWVWDEADPLRGESDDPFRGGGEGRVEPSRGGAPASMELDRQKEGAISVPPVPQDPWFGPRRDKLREIVPPEEMDALDDIFPDGELDRILDPGAIMTDAPRREPPVPMTEQAPPRPIMDVPPPSERSTLPDWAEDDGSKVGPPRPILDVSDWDGSKVGPPRPIKVGPPRPILDVSDWDGSKVGPPRPIMDVPPPSERSTLPDWAEDDVINITPTTVDSEWATPEKMQGLPTYMGHIYDDEQGFNPSDPSYAGITQQTYTEWRERNRMYGAPADVQDLARQPEVISVFYQDYIAEANVPRRFMQHQALEYMYVDFAIHGGHEGARRMLRDAQRMLRAEGVTHPNDTELLQAFNRAKRNFYDKQGGNAASFIGRADRVMDRAWQMMRGDS